MTKYILFLCIVLAGIWYFNNANLIYQRPLETLKDHLLEEVKKEIHTSPPLRAKEESPQALLPYLSFTTFRC